MQSDCACRRVHDPCRFVVLTGGPGAGKTAVLEVVKRSFCEHVVVLPEAASIVFGGGFPRRESLAARKAAQRAIACVQRELETLVDEEHEAAVALCDRGVLDGLAYWPDDRASYLAAIGTTEPEALARYAAVIHLRTPTAERGYDHRNPLRVESATDAAAIDARIAEAWAGHPSRFEVESTADFIDKIVHVVARIRDVVPACCRTHPLVGIETSADGDQGAFSTTSCSSKSPSVVRTTE